MARGKYPRCPLSGKKVTVEPFSETKLFRVVSPYGWCSRLFATEGVAKKWAESVPFAPFSIYRTTGGELQVPRFIVRGPGWTSKPFETEEEALFWYMHRNGQPLKGAVPPAKLQVSESQEPEEIEVPFTVKDVVVTAEESLEYASLQE